MQESCYSGMFYNCTSLTTAPQLPATTLSDFCYWWMFEGCTSLTTVPQLPATTLSVACYLRMFEGCTSLTTLPELPAITLTEDCYLRMFEGCSNIKISETQTWIYQTPYRIPSSWTWGESQWWNADMFDATWGTFTWDPSINTTYYTSNTVI